MIVGKKNLTFARKQGKEKRKKGKVQRKRGKETRKTGYPKINKGNKGRTQ